MMIRRVAAVLALTAVLFTAAPAQAGAGPVSNWFYAYDFRYETPYECYGQTCWHIPYGGPHQSTFNAPALTRTVLRDAIGGRYNSMGHAVVAGQNVGVMCWKAASNGSIWLTVDSRHLDQEGSSALFISWVPDANVKLSRDERLRYVVECGYYRTVA